MSGIKHCIASQSPCTNLGLDGMQTQQAIFQTQAKIHVFKIELQGFQGVHRYLNISIQGSQCLPRQWFRGENTLIFLLPGFLVLLLFTALSCTCLLGLCLFFLNFFLIRLLPLTQIQITDMQDRTDHWSFIGSNCKMVGSLSLSLELCNAEMQFSQMVLLLISSKASCQFKRFGSNEFGSCQRPHLLQRIGLNAQHQINPLTRQGLINTSLDPGFDPITCQTEVDMKRCLDAAFGYKVTAQAERPGIGQLLFHQPTHSCQGRDRELDPRLDPGQLCHVCYGSGNFCLDILFRQLSLYHQAADLLS